MEKEKEITIRLFGSIGDEVNGNDFARILSEADSKYETVNLQINSYGGDVGHGYSILSVMLTMQATVNVTVVGIAASMAAVIAVCGKHVYMNDYSRMMIHNPYFPKTDNETLSPEARKALENIQESLCTILSRRGYKNEEVAKLMCEETWFTADEALSKGFIDGIISTKKQEYKNLATEDIYSCISASFIRNSKQNKTDIIQKLGSVLGLRNAPEEEILNAVHKTLTQNKVGKALQKLEEAKKKGRITDNMFESMKKLCDKDSDTVLNILQEQQEARRLQCFEKYKSCIYKAVLVWETKSALIELSKIDLELFEKLMPCVEAAQSLGTWIKRSKEGNGRNGWTLEDYRKNAPEELKRNPELYQKLIEQEEKRNK